MRCGVGRRRGSDPALLRLWHRPVATAPIRPLAWEPPHATGVALEKAKKKKKKKKKEVAISISLSLHKQRFLKLYWTFCWERVIENAQYF